MGVEEREEHPCIRAGVLSFAISFPICRQEVTPTIICPTPIIIIKACRRNTPSTNPTLATVARPVKNIKVPKMSIDMLKQNPAVTESDNGAEEKENLWLGGPSCGTVQVGTTYTDLPGELGTGGTPGCHVFSR